MLKNIGLLALLLPATAGVSSPERGMERSLSVIPLDSTTKLALTNARALWVDYRGRHALKLAPLVGHERDVDQALVATLTETDFTNGTIEIDVSGARREGYSKAEDVSGFKGIVGISFSRSRRQRRAVLHQAGECTAGQSTLSQSLNTVRVGSRLLMAAASAGKSGRV